MGGMVNKMKTIFVCLMTLMFLGSGLAYAAGPYTNSAHGNTSYGVYRNSTTQYGTGNCAHCHEQHASIGGTEPTPNTLDAAGPDKFCLLANNFDTTATTGAYVQDDNVCFYCHYGTGTYQSSAFSNYTYSITFGGNSDTTPATIFNAFNSTSYHNLNDVLNFAKGASGWPSTFTADSNPCAACHNVHIAQRSCGKPSGSYDPTKSAISKPSDHNNLWGDETGERMKAYADASPAKTYQAPLWFGSATNHEPANNTTEDGSNLPDHVAFCTDCHNSSNTIYSTTLTRNLKTIDWDNEVHGKGNADTYITVDSPYTSGSGSLGYVLSCLDCHEPHGSPNAFLIRKEVNGGALGGSITTFDTTNWHYLCDRCHQDDKELQGSCQEDHYGHIHHSNTYGHDPYYTGGMCSGCHSPAFTPETPVLMSDRTYRPIGEIKTGDKVLSFDFDNNTTCESEVVNVSSHFVSETLEINGVGTTSEQLFAVGTDRWVQAGKLKTGDTVLGLAEHMGGLEKIKLEKPVSLRHPQEVEVVEIIVKGTHNFFVIGKGNKFLVHNPMYSCNSGVAKKVCTDCHYHGSSHSGHVTF